MVGALPWDYPCLAHMVRVLVCLTPPLAIEVLEKSSLSMAMATILRNHGLELEKTQIHLVGKAAEMLLLVTSHSGGTWQKEERSGEERENRRGWKSIFELGVRIAILIDAHNLAALPDCRTLRRDATQ
ncbi:uncharacterized protein TrAFT101_004288 [Trichoderma asperellum]|nr:hypothetical protein TrAFT101_004288 [Trichoderma asperellum]